MYNRIKIKLHILLIKSYDFGKAITNLVEKHSSKCCLIMHLSHETTLGSSLCANDVMTAIANKPQSTAFVILYCNCDLHAIIAVIMIYMSSLDLILKTKSYSYKFTVLCSLDCILQATIQCLHHLLEYSVMKNNSSWFGVVPYEFHQCEEIDTRSKNVQK